MQDILVSVIIPCFNVAGYVEKSAWSVTNQSYKNIEVILVDDGSSDETLLRIGFLEERDSRIKVIAQKNQGVVAARKNGFLASRGNIVLFVDGDDRLVDSAVAEIVSAFENNEVDLVRFGYSKVNLEGIRLRDEIPSLSGVQTLDSLIGEGTENLKAHFSTSIWDKAYRRNLVTKVFSEIGDVRINHSEDMLFSIVAFLQIERSFFLSKALYRYTLRPGSAIESFNHRAVECKVLYFKELVRFLSSSNNLFSSLNVQAFLELEANEAINYVLFNTMAHAPSFRLSHTQLRDLKDSVFFKTHLSARIQKNVRQNFRNAGIRNPWFCAVCLFFAQRLRKTLA